MHAKPNRTVGYRGRHRRPSRLRLLLAAPLVAMTPAVA